MEKQDDSVVSQQWWQRVRKFLDYRKRVGMTQADQDGVWLIPMLYGVDGCRRKSIKKIARTTGRSESELKESQAYLESLIRRCVSLK